MGGKWVFWSSKKWIDHPKANFPGNTFGYINQASLSLVNGGEKAMYLEFVVLGKIMSAANIDPAINLDTHVFNEN